MPRSGSLTIVGTGIQVGSQTTPEAATWIQRAEKLLFLAADPLSFHWLTQMNATAESLADAYDPDKLRRASYLEMVERTMAFVRRGLEVCVAAYGHPGVFAYPMHEAIKRARAEGYPAKMLPGVSAADCMFADLGIDPGRGGCQFFEATDFLLSRRRFDRSSSLVLWQVGVVGELSYKPRDGVWNPQGLRTLVEVLLEHYAPSHECVVYEAASFACCDPSVERTAVAQLARTRITPRSTLYLPPMTETAPDPAMARRLGIELVTSATDCDPPPA